MNTLNKDQKIAVSLGIGLVAYLLFGGLFFDLFTSNNAEGDTEAMQESQELPLSGIRVTDLTPGSGPVVESGDTLTLHYVGTLPGGKVFDSSIDRNQPFTFVVGAGQVIRGWEEGLVGMREGGTRRILIAPDYGYGAQAVGTIPSNSHLIFEVELLDVSKPGQ